MFSVLIVEDEILVRIGLKASVDWEKLGMKVIADVPNGQVALEVYKKEKPDLILTDIKMPIMDGIQLISNIRQNDKFTKIVILTCLEEFDLARKALQLGVSNYILKLKMAPAEIENVLINVLDEMNTENNSRPQEQIVKIDHTLIKENLIKEYLFYNLYSENKFAKMIDKLNIRMSPERIVMCLMSIDRYDILQDKFDDKQGNLIRFAVLNIIEELLNGYQKGEVINDKEEKYILFFCFPDITSENSINEVLMDILTRIYNTIQIYTGTSVTFALSKINNGFKSLKLMYDDCNATLKMRYFISGPNQMCVNSSFNQEVKPIIETKLIRIMQETEKISDSYTKEIKSGIETIINDSEPDRTKVNKLFLRWIFWPAMNLNMNLEHYREIALKYTEVFNCSTTLDDAIETFMQFLFEISQFQGNAKCYSKEVYEAIQFIRKYYNMDITLQQAAEFVMLSPGYLSSLFKKELNMNFIDYLNRVRIEKAKDILSNSSLKSYEVAEKVGFTDESYFSRLFKRYTGVRPMEFRKKRLVDINEVNQC